MAEQQPVPPPTTLRKKRRVRKPPEESSVAQPRVVPEDRDAVDVVWGADEHIPVPIEDINEQPELEGPQQGEETDEESNNDSPDEVFL